MGIRQRGATFLVDVTVKGIRRTATCPTREQAEATEAQLRATLYEQLGNLPQSNGWTLRQAYQRAAELWDDNATSAAKLKALAQEALEYFGESTDCAKISTDHIHSYTVYLKEHRQNGNATINRKVSALSKMLTCALRSGKLTSPKPHIDRKREGEGRIRYITPQEEQEMLSLLTYWGKFDVLDTCTVLIDTGLRPSELWRLTERDINFVTGMLTIWKTKTRKPRSLPMTPRVKTILWKRSKALTGELFPYDNYWMGREWERLKRHMGLSEDKHFIPYCLRHTCISRLAQSKKVPFPAIKEWAGHTNINTTMRYAHPSPQNFVDAAEVLSEFSRTSGFNPSGEDVAADVAPTVAEDLQ